MPLKSAYYEKKQLLKSVEYSQRSPYSPAILSCCKPHRISTCFPDNTDS